MKGYRLFTVTAVMALHVAADTDETQPQQQQQQLLLRGGVRKLNLEQGICHAVGGTKKEEYSLLSGIPIMALKNHMEQHGDGIPGGPVPHKPGCTFSPTCEIVCAPVCPCWPEGKPLIAIGDVIEANKASVGDNPSRGYREEYEVRTTSGVRMGAYFEGNQTTCVFARNFEPRNIIITTREEHDICVKETVDLVADISIAYESSIAPVCQPRPNVQFLIVSCPCWRSVDALPAPVKVPFESERYYLSYTSFSGWVAIDARTALGVVSQGCTGPRIARRISQEEREVCYDELLEYARFYNSTNRCHDPWRDKEGASLQLSITQEPIRFDMPVNEANVTGINLFDYVSNAVGDLEIIEVNGQAKNVDEDVDLLDDLYYNDQNVNEFRYFHCQGGENEGRDGTPDAWFHIRSDGMANFTQMVLGGSLHLYCPNLMVASILDKSPYTFDYLRGGQRLNVSSTFTILDTFTGQTVNGTLTIQVIGINTSPYLQSACVLHNDKPFNEREVTPTSATARFGNVLNRFSDEECDFPLAFGSINSLSRPNLPVDIRGDNGGIYHFLVNGEVVFDANGELDVGMNTSVEISISDSLGATTSLFSLHATYVDTLPMDGPL